MSQISIDRARITSLSGSVFASPSLQQSGSGLLLQGWLIRTLAVAVFFAAQGIWLTVRFDTGTLVVSGTLAESSGIAAEFLRLTPLLLRIGITALIVIPCLRGRRLLEDATAFAHASREHAWWRWWLAEWTAFALLVLVSLQLFGTSAAVIIPLKFSTATWTLLWAMAAISTGLTCLFSMARPTFWWQFAMQQRWVLTSALVVALAATLGGGLFQTLWSPLGESTFRLVEFWLSLFYSDALVSDAGERLLGTEAFFVHIAPQCSGYEGMGLVSVFILAFLAVFRKTLRFPRAWLLWPLGVLAIWVCNTLRIAALVVIGTEYSAEVALGGFHSQAGWILFNLVSLGMMAAALKSSFFAVQTASTVRVQAPVVPYLSPFVVLTALSMFLAALFDNAAALYPLAVVASLSMLWMSRNVLRQLNWTWSTPAFLCGVAVYVVWTGLAWFELRPNADHAPVLPGCDTPGGLSWTLFRVFGATITVPIIEELAFRGFLLRRLIRSNFETLDYRTIPLWAVLVSSVAFGLLHQLWIGGILAGLAYTWLTRQRGNLVEAIQAHAVTNGLIAVTVLCTGAAWLW